MSTEANPMADDAGAAGSPPLPADSLDVRKAGNPTGFRILMFHNRVLRPGWGIVLFCLIFFATLLVEVQLIESARTNQLEPHVVQTPRDVEFPLISLIAVAVATVLPSYLEQRRASVYGLRGPRWRPALLGAATSLVLLAATAFGLHAAGLLLPLPWSVPTRLAARQSLMWAGFFALTTLYEQLLTRGYLQYTLTRGCAFLYRRFLGLENGIAAGFWTGAVLTSLLFCRLYYTNPGQTETSPLCVFVLGLLYCLSVWRTGGLWWAIGFQLTWDWVQAYVLGLWSGGLPIRDHLMVWLPGRPEAASGGNAGLNGSEWIFVTLAAAFALLMLLVRPVRPYPELWEQAETEGEEMADTLPDPDRP